MAKKICNICKNEEHNPEAKFCKICGTSLEVQKQGKYEVIIREKSNGKDIQRMECDGALFATRTPGVRKDGQVMAIGMIGMNPLHQIMALKGIQEGIQKDALSAMKKIDPNLINKITDDFMDMIEKTILKNKPGGGNIQ